MGFARPPKWFQGNAKVTGDLRELKDVATKAPTCGSTPVGPVERSHSFRLRQLSEVLYDR